MSEVDREWYKTFKPTFTTDGGVLYRSASKKNKDREWKEEVMVREGKKSITVSRLQSDQVSKPFLSTIQGY